MKELVVGIDEVGRGSLAGPVLVAAAAVPRRFRGAAALGPLRDSKRLTAAQREEWLSHLKNHPSISFAVARVFPRAIDRKNISGAANIAAHRAFVRLCNANRLRYDSCRVFLDGGLFLKSKMLQPPNAKTVVKGDERIAAVKVASIVAKVARDRAMRRLARKFPVYGFDINKGYGTKAHINALRRRGPSPAHRLSFLRFLAKSGAAKFS